MRVQKVMEHENEGYATSGRCHKVKKLVKTKDI